MPAQDFQSFNHMPVVNLELLLTKMSPDRFIKCRQDNVLKMLVNVCLNKQIILQFLNFSNGQLNTTSDRYCPRMSSII